ncbi:MAG: hypothetical protein R3F54_06955 [Alphaproteobacteria bacterium]
MAMLSACSGPRPQIERRLGDRQSALPESHGENLEAVTADAGAAHQEETSARLDAVPPAHRGDERRYPRQRDFHEYEEPSPEARRMAEAALILTGSALICTFVVVVLDGACEFGVGFGYHYY